MSEPLTKVKLLEKASPKPLTKNNIHCGCPNGCDSYDEECSCAFLYKKDLKSALEEFERLIKMQCDKSNVEEYIKLENEFINDPEEDRAIFLLKKAFPAIYKNEEMETED